MATSPFAGQPVLITGGLGFIGSTLAHRLVREGAQVTIVDNLIPEYGGNMHNIEGIDGRVAVKVSDVRDVETMRSLIQGCQFVFNLAGQTSHLDSMHDPYTDLEINCRAQLSILEVCRQVNPGVRLVFASTRQIYGKPDYLPVDEKHLLQPVDVNGINKMAGEWYHVLYSRVYGIPACALRLTNTYGPRMRVKDARQTFVGIWIRLILEGRPFEVWDGHQKRDFTYVDDAVEALMLAATHPAAGGRVFNLGGADPPVTLEQLAALLVKVNGRGEYALRAFPEDRKRIDIGDYYADDRLIRGALGWRPNVTLDDGLARTLAYYREHLPHYL